MPKQIQFSTLLVPVDFSPASDAAFEQCVSLVSGDDALLIVLHVIDPSLAEFAARHELGSRDDVAELMREKAESRLEQYVSRAEGVDVQTIVSEGVPFLEILRKAQDFAVDAIVIGKVGVGGKVENLLFGSTAEKVLRGSTCPVLVLPEEES